MQQEPNISQPPIPKKQNPLVQVVAALAVILFIGLPLAYYTGQSNGYNVGCNTRNFDFYYIKPEQKYGVYELSGWLANWKWIRPYQEGVFDCSEMSAYLEWKLENEGWHTYIVIGDCPFGPGNHAWLLVETSNDQYMPVESTTMSVVWWDSQYFDSYFTYEHQFESIQDALSHSATEFDWWKS